MTIVHLMRGGAPDKANLEVNGYDLVKHNNTNLRSMTYDRIKSLTDNNQYILPADEGDISFANNLPDDINIDYILLPHVKVDGRTKVIDYKYIQKCSKVYELISELSTVKYMPYEMLTVSEFEDKLDKEKYFTNVALKTTTGSGSRGIFIANKKAYDMGLFNYHPVADRESLKSFIEFAKSEEVNHGSKIMMQELVPIEYTKVNVDFVIRNGILLTYKWDLPEPGSNFTNWNWLKVVRNEWTNKVMAEISELLINKIGVTDAIMNFEAYQYIDYTDSSKNLLYMIEFNWRYSNSYFESFAFGDDLVRDYLENTKFVYPYGETAVVRSWKAVKESDLVNFK